jgi:hypothetical protein
MGMERLDDELNLQSTGPQPISQGIFQRQSEAIDASDDEGANRAVYKTINKAHVSTALQLEALAIQDSLPSVPIV